MHYLPVFGGFPKKSLTFLRALKRNNRREWFQPRKQEYEELLRLPMQSLVAALADKCARTIPDIVFEPKKAVFRIYRDVRFSSDKSPYKTHVAASFNPPHSSKEYETAGLYLHVEPSTVFAAGGLYMPNSSQLRKIREAIQENPGPFLAVVKNPAFKRRFRGLSGAKLKTSPRGISPDHPMIEFLRLKQFHVSCEYSDKDIFSKSFADKIARDLRLMMPLVRWLWSVTEKPEQIRKIEAKFSLAER